MDTFGNASLFTEQSTKRTWDQLSGWSKAWRSTLAFSLLGAGTILCLCIHSFLQRDTISTLETPLGTIYAIIFPVLFGIITFVLSPALRRVHFLAQAALLGLTCWLGVGGLFIFAGYISDIFLYGWEFFLNYLSVPIVLMTVLGYVLAFACISRVGTIILGAIGLAAITIFLALKVLSVFGIFTTFSHPGFNNEPELVCIITNENGQLISLPCR